MPAKKPAVRGPKPRPPEPGKGKEHLRYVDSWKPGPQPQSKRPDIRKLYSTKKKTAPPGTKAVRTMQPGGDVKRPAKRGRVNYVAGQKTGRWTLDGRTVGYGKTEESFKPVPRTKRKP